jgi:flagellar motor protein MotB
MRTPFRGLLLVAAACSLQAAVPDFPYLTRLPNYEIVEGDEKDQTFASYQFFDGKKWQAVEGRFWKRAYSLKTDAQASSHLQIVRNYANAIKAAGGSVTFQGEVPNGSTENYPCYDILCGKLTKGAATVWVLVNPCNEGNDYALYAIETKAMAQEVTAKDLLNSLDANGFVALDIHFDTNKATIKPESQALVSQLVEMLKAKPSLKVSIEGHTDNTGTPAGNKQLSEDRAKAVLAAVSAKGNRRYSPECHGLGPGKARG